jgi:hypothetical protein
VPLKVFFFSGRISIYELHEKQNKKVAKVATVFMKNVLLFAIHA